MLDPWLLDHLACPRCHERLALHDRGLVCPRAHRYPVVDDIPIMVLDDVEQTHWAATHSMELARAGAPAESRGADAIDPIVQEAIGATGGNLYGHLIGNLTRYPIPGLDLEAPRGTSFLDIGCHWGRWCVAAARKGWRVVGIDPYLPAIRAAKRVAADLSVDAMFLVGDGRYLPFAASTFQLAHAYSVLQHFAEDDVRACTTEIGRVLAPGGRSHVQMAQRHGLRNYLQQARRGFRRPRSFEVRYWPLDELRAAFTAGIGPTTLSVDGFFSLNAQSADLDLLRPVQRAIVKTSNALRALSARRPWLVYAADSVYVDSRKI
jgi:SAM-dependent methyltransferase